ncbi:MAG TPA: SDR family oxidoreductase [Myxococcota bacterium]|nr:SDR family oxidoreductase [Myxococcota bacterium]
MSGNDYLNLSGNVYLITGGTQGLGEAIAGHLTDLGAAGICICGRNVEAGRRVAAELAGRGTQAHFVAADLLRVEDCRRVVEQCQEHFGRIDGLVNAAATTARGGIEDATPEVFDRMMALNVRAPFLLMQGCVKAMRSQGGGGAIVNILSISAHGGQPKLTIYCTSKGALLTMTKNLANALRGDRIRVYGLNIGWMATPGEDVVQKIEGAPADWLDAADRAAPFGRILRPLDVARLVGFMVSEGGRMATGSIIDFDQMVIGAFD